MTLKFPSALSPFTLDDCSGWQVAKIGDVAEIVMGQSPPSATYNTSANGLPFFQGKSEFCELYPVIKKYCNAPGKIAEPNDVLLSIRAPVGPTNMCEVRSCIGRGLAAIRPYDKIPSKFLLYYFRCIESWLSMQGAGSTFTAINREDMCGIEIPVPPLVEQKRIVAKLDEILGKVSSIQQRLSRIPTLLKRFRQSVLAAACSGKLTEDWRSEHSAIEEWSPQRLGSILQGKPQNGLYKPQSAYGAGTLIVRIDGFYDGTIAPWDELKRLRVTRQESALYELSNNDVLINRVNSMKYLGKSALVRNLREPCVFESNMMRVKLDTKLVEPEYAILYLQSLRGLEELRKNAKHAVNQSSINQGDVGDVELDLPPINEQLEIIRRVEQLFAFADQIEARFESAKAHIDRLTQSVLAKAFRGELVPTEAELARREGRDYETAEQLLERIKAAATTNAKQPKRSRKPADKP